MELNLSKLTGMAKLFSHIIDFRSSFTATHSSGVATTAEKIAQFYGFSEKECKMMKFSGYLHDIGKLKVPKEILEKPGRLTKYEFNIIKTHTYYTYRVLEKIKGIELVNTWASFHHETLNGKGYPFHLKGEDLSLGSRIMAITDRFTALIEKRPYRKSMNGEEAVKLMERMAERREIDGEILNILKRNLKEIEESTINAQKQAKREYANFFKSKI